MRAVRFHEHGGSDVLQVDEIDQPALEPKSVVVEVEAAGVNPVDTYFREGAKKPATMPAIPGIDFAGTVAEVDESIERFEPGDRVFGTGVGGAVQQGSYAEYVTAPGDRLVRLPDGIDVTSAGGAGVVGVTAWRALIHHAELRPSEWCLVHGGSGGVGHVAVQLAAATSARVITTAAPEYHDQLSELGADTVLDYDRSDLADAVVDASGGGVDVVLDHRLDDYLQFDAEVAATGARVVGIGENDPVIGFTDDGVARSKDLTYSFMSMFNTPDFRVPLRGIARLLADGAISCEVKRTYDLEEAALAHDDVMTESFLGKFVIVP